MNLINEQRLRHYRLLEPIGQGAMSVVYRGFDEKLLRNVAVKVLHPFLAEKLEYRQRLHNEAKAVSRLVHPNIVQVYDYAAEDFLSAVDDPRQLFVVTELVNGTTLKTFAEKQQIWKLPELGACIVWVLAQALVHAHLQGVLHRDIKPENVMISHDGAVKLMDFGIAKTQAQGSLTMTGTLLGSPAYMAPEIIEGRRGDQRSDVYSLAVVLYYLCTGSLPYLGDNPHSLMRAVVLGNAPAASEVSSKVTAALSDVIAQGMALDPDLRYADAKTFAAQIADALAHGRVDVASVSLPDVLNEIGVWESELLAAYLKRAEVLLAQARPASAFALLSRVLATEPDNAVALALLGQKLPEKNAKLRRWRVLLSAGLISGLIIVLACSWMLMPVARPEGSVDTFAKTPPPLTAPTPTSRPTPVPTPTPAPTPAPARPPEVPVAKKAGPIVAAPSPRNVLIKAVPFADIYVDGTLKARDAHELKVALLPGPHVIFFKHRYAESVEKEFELVAGNEPYAVNATLDKPKPALLVVHSNIDADIAIAGVYKGSSAIASKTPVIISMPKFAHMVRLEVIVSQRGFKPYVQEHTFHAGETTSLNVSLQPKIE